MASGIEERVARIYNFLSQLVGCHTALTNHELSPSEKEGIKGTAKTICKDIRKETNTIMDEIDTW